MRPSTASEADGTPTMKAGPVAVSSSCTRLLVVMAVQHELGAVLLEHPRRICRRRASPRRQLACPGRGGWWISTTRNRSSPLQAASSALGKKLALRRADLAGGDERHGRDGRGQRDERDVAEAAHERETRSAASGSAVLAGLVGLHVRLPVPRAAARDAAAHRRRDCRGSPSPGSGGRDDAAIRRRARIPQAARD